MTSQAQARPPAPTPSIPRTASTDDGLFLSTASAVSARGSVSGTALSIVVVGAATGVAVVVGTVAMGRESAAKTNTRDCFQRDIRVGVVIAVRVGCSTTVVSRAVVVALRDRSVSKFCNAWHAKDHMQTHLAVGARAVVAVTFVVARHVDDMERELSCVLMEEIGFKDCGQIEEEFRRRKEGRKRE